MENKPTITIEELTSDEQLIKIEKILDDHLEKVFSKSNPKTYAEFKTAMHADYERKDHDLSWLLDHGKANWKKYFKLGEQNNRELRFKKHLRGK